MTTETVTSHLFKQISSVVEESFLEEASTNGILPHDELVIPPSPRCPHQRYIRVGSLRGSVRRLWRRPRASSPRYGRSPGSSFGPANSRSSSFDPSTSPANPLRLENPLVKTEEIIKDVHNILSEKRGRGTWISFLVVYTMIFFNGCCFTAVVPSVPFYLQQLHAAPPFLGWVVSFYSLGQIIGSPTAGWLTSHMNSKHLLTISSTLGLCSSSLYAIAPNAMFVLISRLLTGISAGMEFATELAFIAKTTSTVERTAFLATVTAVNVLGFMLGPALGTILAVLNITILGYNIDQYNGPGWLLAAMFVMDVFLVRFLFHDPETLKHDVILSTEKKSLLSTKIDNDNSYGAIPNDESCCDESSGENDEERPDFGLVVSMIFFQFTIMCGFSVLETITSPLAQEHFDWDVFECNLLFTAGGTVGLIAYVVFVVASKWIQDRALVGYSLILCFIGFVLAIDWQQLNWTPEWIVAILPSYVDRFVAGYLVLNVGFLTGRPVVFALYSKLIASEYQGMYLGWMVAGGSAARTLGPFAAVKLYFGFDNPGINILALFGVTALFHLACLVLLWLQWSTLIPGQNNGSGKERNSTKTAA